MLTPLRNLRYVQLPHPWLPRSWKQGTITPILAAVPSGAPLTDPSPRAKASAPSPITWRGPAAWGLPFLHLLGQLLTLSCQGPSRTLVTALGQPSHLQEDLTPRAPHHLAKTYVQRARSALQHHTDDGDLDGHAWDEAQSPGRECGAPLHLGASPPPCSSRLIARKCHRATAAFKG